MSKPEVIASAITISNPEILNGHKFHIVIISAPTKMTHVDGVPDDMNTEFIPMLQEFQGRKFMTLVPKELLKQVMVDFRILTRKPEVPMSNWFWQKNRTFRDIFQKDRRTIRISKFGKSPERGFNEIFYATLLGNVVLATKGGAFYFSSKDATAILDMFEQYIPTDLVEKYRKFRIALKNSILDGVDKIIPSARTTADLTPENDDTRVIVRKVMFPDFQTIKSAHIAFAIPIAGEAPEITRAFVSKELLKGVMVESGLLNKKPEMSNPEWLSYKNRVFQKISGDVKLVRIGHVDKNAPAYGGVLARIFGKERRGGSFYVPHEDAMRIFDRIKSNVPLESGRGVVDAISRWVNLEFRMIVDKLETEHDAAKQTAPPESKPENPVKAVQRDLSEDVSVPEIPIQNVLMGRVGTFHGYEASGPGSYPFDFEIGCVPFDDPEEPWNADVAKTTLTTTSGNSAESFVAWIVMKPITGCSPGIYIELHRGTFVSHLTHDMLVKFAKTSMFTVSNTMLYHRNMDKFYLKFPMNPVSNIVSSKTAVGRNIHFWLKFMTDFLRYSISRTWGLLPSENWGRPGSCFAGLIHIWNIIETDDEKTMLTNVRFYYSRDTVLEYFGKFGLVVGTPPAIFMADIILADFMDQSGKTMKLAIATKDAVLTESSTQDTFLDGLLVDDRKLFICDHTRWSISENNDEFDKLSGILKKRISTFKTDGCGTNASDE